MSLLKAGLKSSNNTAVPFNGDASGNVYSKHIWETSTEDLLTTTEIRNTEQHNTLLADLAEWGTFSLRITNTLKADGVNVACSATPQFDQGGTSYNMKNASGDNINIEIPYGYVFITPEDYPLFNYLSSFRLGITASTTPTSGSISIKIVKKR